MALKPNFITFKIRYETLYTSFQRVDLSFLTLTYNVRYTALIQKVKNVFKSMIFLGNNDTNNNSMIPDATAH
jgi:hypothetical protein